MEIPIKNTNQRIIVHEPNKYYEKSLEYAFNTLKIDAYFECNENKFIKSILDNKYDHIFLSINSMKLLQSNRLKLDIHAKITVMVDRSSNYSMVKNTKIIEKSLYCLPIAAILNNENIMSI